MWDKQCHSSSTGFTQNQPLIRYLKKTLDVMAGRYKLEHKYNRAVLSYNM